jgi:hypothetical protein
MTSLELGLIAPFYNAGKLAIPDIHGFQPQSTPGNLREFVNKIGLPV